MSTPINKILLEYSPVHFFSNVCGYFCAITAELNDFDRDHLAYNAENIYHLAFYRKKLLTPALHNSGHKSESKLSNSDESNMTFLPRREKAISYSKHTHCFQKEHFFPGTL